MRRARGITLIEVMVVLGIIGFVMTVIYGVLFGTLRIQRNVERGIQGSRIGPMLLDQIENDLRQLYTLNMNPDHVFRGEDNKISGMDADRLSFVAQVPSTSAHEEEDKLVFSAVNEICYTVTQSKENPDFLVLWRREDFFIDDEPLEGGKGTRLYGRIVGFDVVYFDRLGEEAEEIEEWDPEDRDGLPAALRMTLSLEIEPRPQGFLDQEDIDRRRYTFQRWIRFPRDSALALAVRPLVPLADGASGEGSNGTGPPRGKEGENPLIPDGGSGGAEGAGGGATPIMGGQGSGSGG